MLFNFPSPAFGGLTQLLAIASLVLNFLLHLFLTIGVYSEASDRSIRGRKLWFIGPFLWAFATFVGGVLTAAIYWLMHHSTLGPVETTDPDEI